jgi:phospholipid N-methyltransferase
MASLQEEALSFLSNSRTSRQTLLFARNFLKHPFQLGSVVPSSRFLIKRLLSPVDWERARVVVEYGPGIGTITREVLKRMRPDATLVAIELNSDFVEFLRTEFDDPRLRVVHGSAADVMRTLRALNLPAADYIISGIPYSTIPAPIRHEILEQSRELLSHGGAMLVYQFTRVVAPHLKRRFRSVEQGFTPLNILPAHIFHCRV